MYSSFARSGLRDRYIDALSIGVRRRSRDTKLTFVASVTEMHKGRANVEKSVGMVDRSTRTRKCNRQCVHADAR